ncbi:MAG: hypothetical protein ABSB74_06670 [Tepidisphaeraceae bacterium]
MLGLPAYVQAGTAGNGWAERIAAARQEKDVDFNDIPKVVQDAVVTASGGAKVRHVTQYVDVVNGKLHYHVVAGNGVVRQTFVLDKAGNLLITKDKIDFGSLPDQVKETMGKEAGPGNILDSVEKANDLVKTYYIGTTIQGNGRIPDKIIRVSEDGKLISGIPEDDIPLTNEKVVPQSYRVLRAGIKTETVKLDDLPGPVKATIGADAESDPVDSVVHILPGVDVPDAYVATVGKGADTQRKIFVDGNGDALDGVAELRPYIRGHY